MFGNAPKALWQRWAPADDQNRIRLACRALLSVEPDRCVLFETGIGAFFEPTLAERYGVQEAEHVLLASLAAAGFDEARIDVVVLSHLHFDHAGGLLSQWRSDAEPTLHFPNARYVVGRSAWQRACDPHVRDRASFVPVLQELLEASGRLEVVDESDESALRAAATRFLGPGGRFHVSNGHTPGMLLAELPGGRGPLVFAGDLVPAQPWVRRAITMGYDRYPERLIDEKSALLRDLHARGGALFYTHDPDCAVSWLERDARDQLTPARSMAALDAEVW